MSGLSKLGTGLIIVFAISLLGLFGELCYVLWCRRRFRRQNLAGQPDAIGDPDTSPSKELLYFLCWKNQSRIEPAGAPAPRSADAPLDPGDLMKWQELYGPSRVLFTIKEEEREDLESEKSSSERKMMKSAPLKECFEPTGEEPAAMATVMVDIERETPFSTPCASPPYYTPSPSPPRELQMSDGNLTSSPEIDRSFILEVVDLQRKSPENDFSGGNKGCPVSLEVQSE